MAHHLTTCTFCGVGCGLYLETADNQVVGVYPSASHPTNAGRICARGWHVHEVASSPDRLKHPLLRKRDRLEEVSWAEALDFAAGRLREIRDRYGPDALAFLNSPRCSNEEAYLLQKLARAVIGTNNVHHGTGVYCNNSINVLIDMLGIPATTGSIQDLEQSELILVDGVDLARRLPTLAGAVIRAKLKGARLIVVGTRRHRVAENADLFVQIRPNTEALLYGAMAKLIVDRGLMDLPFIRERCRDYEPFLEQVRHYDLLQAAAGCGVGADLIEQAAVACARASSAALLYSTSMEERTRDSIRAIVNLMLLTGNLGKPGAGLFALSEQNNLQGVCDMGMLPDRLPGYAPVSDVAARAALESAWRCRLPEKPGVGARAIFTDRGGGRIKGLWLGRYDPISTVLLGDVAGALRHMDLVVMQHLFLNDTAPYAHLVLPTTAFGEEQVSFTSTERRIQLAQRALDPPDGPRPAWQQLTQLAQMLGAGWNYQSAAEIMEEIGQVVPFYGGAGYDNLARDYGRQWPCSKDRPLGTARLFADGDGKRFRFESVPVPESAPQPAQYPFTLVFGNSLYYWNQNVLIRHSEALKREYRILSLDYPDGFVEIHDGDARRLGIRDGDRVRLRTPSASADSVARVTREVMPGTVFVPYFVRHVEQQILGAAGEGGKLVPVRVEKETDGVRPMPVPAGKEAA